ncbi:Dolichyl-phosphate-mannose-protein mannosyltransferase [Candidatus Kryptonium thompsonii]|uniref:Dolichyl-phosphate-mannose-protein mannosyltransferase n=1 Tax=Candidatus Kryptonium thompsonii TaxID=1633631 RepID=A0A0P1MJI5_9BACT|nr:glycosyltransferase family 39 protein [Candidatus Kryptonium thompsoni]CUS76611.1 Dolichyl-phosphate-mannose-protein mannosyltransferase [Candidatus Kryptonium thompsoni]CUS76788.1 Dolichyl-phosphate-mannose-protein mannosyltransferase [Candidatus Kryptonium thompsoni]CUS83083.1 Dolichyl-phosphate-mannose-protein mannosyltransferase [Candidatus Kryptonium thompsoni]CUS91920.1 Dolichyl-phosphate-mannose-protein mannosyltransferase [Candidatus Kryptonium thompsoni]CUS95261.1 Dolichyl-phosphat
MRSNVFIFILALSLFLRIFLLDFESLWLDEGSSIKFAKLSIPELIKASQADGNPPLYYLILHFWIKIFGDSEFSFRFPSVIFGVLIVIAVYQFCLEFWSREVAIFSSFMTGISVFQIFYSQEARMYALLCLLSLVSFFYFVKILKQGKFKHYVFYTFTNILLLYTHLYAFFTIFAQLIFVAFQEGKKLKVFLLSLFISFLFFIPRFLIVLKQANEILISGEFWLPRPDFIDFLKTLIQFAGATYPMPRDEFGNVILGRFIIEYSNSAILLFIMLAMIVFSIFNFKEFSHEKRKIYLIFWLWFIIPILVPFALSQFLTPFYFTRYAIASSIAFYCLASIGFENYNGRFRKYIVYIFLLLSVVNLGWYYGKTNKEEWREAVKFVEERARGGDLIIANKYVFYYYSKKDDVVKIKLPDVSEQNKNVLIDELNSLSQKYKRIWFVSSHQPKLEDIVVKVLSNSMSLAMKKKFLGIEIFLFEEIKR